MKVKYFLFLILFFNNFLLFSSKENKDSLVTPPPFKVIAYSFTPAVISPNIEIGNPQRGYTKWSTTPFLSSLPLFDANHRFSWKQIEKSKDVYDFSIIETKLSTLKAGQRFSFRIMPLNTCCSPYKNGAEVPDYIINEKLGWCYTHSYAGSDSIFVPDWNDPELLNRIEKLVQVVGARYDNDPRISFVEIGMYGNWGEWHCYPILYPDSKGGYTSPNPTSPYIFAPSIPDPLNPTLQKYREGSLESKRRILYAHIKAFPHTQLVNLTTDLATLFEALSINTTEKPLGLRRDSWGDPNYTDITAWHNYKPTVDEWDLFNNRWKTAPFYSENWGGKYTTDADMINQLETFKVSGIGFGNFGMDWALLPKAQQDSYLKCGRRVGYRYQISNVNAQMKDSTLTIITSWKNMNIAPTYENWDIQAYVVNETGELFSSLVTIPVNLKLLLNDLASPIIKSVSLTLKAGWKKEKNLQMRIIVKDRANYLLPMNLDMVGRNTDGSYNLFPIGAIETAVNELKFDYGIYGDNQNIVLSGLPLEQTLSIYNFAGQLVKSIKIYDSRMSIGISKGIYLVRVGNQSTKVIVP